MIDSLRGCLHLLCLGFAVAVAARDDFAVGPSNQAVVAGRRMEMECRAKNGSKILKWSLTRTKSTQKEWVCRRGPPIMSYRNFSCTVNEQESVTLFKNSTNPRDAGIYFCYNSPEQKQFKAHLIVFESEPVCEVNQTSSRGENATLATGDEVSMRCRVNFHGQWTPSVEWWKHTTGAEGGRGGGGGGGGGKVVAGRESSTSVSSSSSSEANLLSSSLHVVVAFDLPTYFVFRLFFVWRDDLVSVNASNVPEFRYEWRSPVMFPEQPRIEQVVQVVVETVTSKDNPTGDWYLVSLILLVVVPVIVFSIAVVVIRWCYIGYRRNKGLDQRSMPAKPAFLHGLERPASGEYDVIPYAAPNIYDRIEDGEPIEKSTDAQQQQQQHPPLTQCYSQLSDTTLLPPDPYDALTPYLSMESTPNTPGHCPLPQVPLSERYENRYTEVANRGNMAATTKDNYLTLVGEDEADARETSASDDDDCVSDEDASMSRFAKANGDYLIPFV